MKIQVKKVKIQVLIHCGDFTNTGAENEVKKFNEQLGSLSHPFKIVIAGNHELGFEDNDDGTKWISNYIGKGTKNGYKLLTNCSYLHDTCTEV